MRLTYKALLMAALMISLNSFNGSSPVPLSSGHSQSSTFPVLPSASPVLFSPRTGNEILVAAASDLQFAMDSLVKAFAVNNSGAHIKVVYGSSGNFFQQIANGAPFDLFFSADLGYPQQLVAQHKTLGEVKTYALGQIVLWSKKLDPAKEGMGCLLSPSVARIAIANPAHAPYGKRAQESLEHYQLYDKVKDKLVIGENISQTAAFVSTGAADIGIIAFSLAISPAMQRQGGKYWLIPATTHQPLQQGYALLSHARDNPGARSFADFIGSAKARAILEYFGLGL